MTRATNYGRIAEIVNKSNRNATLMVNRTKLALSILTGCVLALVALWFVFVRAPSPQEICNHTIQLALHESDSQKASTQTLIKSLKATCVAKKQHILLLRGKIFYARHAACVMRATSFEQAEQC